MKKLEAGFGVLLLLVGIYNSIWTFGPVFKPDNSEVLAIRKEEPKSDSPGEYAKYFNEVKTMVGQEGPGYYPGYRLNEFRKLQVKNNARIKGTEALQWIERGPGNVPGRTRGLIIMPDDPTGNTWFIGSAGGGIWKTEDGGGSWVNKTPNLPNLATSIIALSDSDPGVIYAGTGEGYFHAGSITGDGIFKSVDGGESWQQLASTAGNVQFQNINRIVVSPQSPDTLLTCSNGFPPFRSDILKSVDGGQTWKTVFKGTARIQQIIADPVNFNILYATINNQGIIKSTDQGETWSGVGVGLATTGRIELAISPTNSNRLFAAAESDLSEVGSDVFISEDAGQNWMVVTRTTIGEAPAWLAELGWYANSIMVHPFDEDIVYVGGVDMYKAVITEQVRAGTTRILGVQEVGTSVFMDFINSGLSQLRGGLGTGDEWFKDHEGFPIDLQPSDFTSVEIRFGPGKKQMAHRFTVSTTDGTAGDGGAGVAPLGYLYQDYVEVPFEVWDTDLNRQLMVSFRDQERDGKWNLITRDPNDPVPGREYILVHPMDYDPANPDPNVNEDGGQGYKTMYSMWPTLAAGATFDPDNLPESKLSIIYGQLMERKMDHIQMTNTSGVFTPTSNTVHPDIHNIQSFSNQAGVFRFILATDGGMYSSTQKVAPGESDADWRHSTLGNNTTQFYSIDKMKGDSKYIGGTQDNGTWVNFNINPDKDTRYIHKIGGDGFDAIWNYKDANKLVGSAQNNQIRLSVDGGDTWQSGITGLDDTGDEKAPFFSVIENHKGVPNTLYAVGVSGVWKSTNFAESWTSKPITDKWVSSGGEISSSHTVVISKANPSIVWAGGGMTTERSMSVSTNSGNTFRTTPNVADTIGSISGFATHPTEEFTAYVLFSFAEYGKIFRTTDLGNTWEDISGYNGTKSSSTGFPEVGISTLLVLPNDPNTIWVGSEIGIIESNDNGKSWHALDGTLPAVSVWALKAADDQVLAATHGRGIWSVTIPDLVWPVEIIAGIEKEELTNFATLYPNPADTHATINYENLQPGTASLSIIQSDGRVLLKKEIQILGSGKINIDTSILPEGVQIVNIKTATISYSTRLMVRH